jgi:hypothetical protein
MTLPGGDGGDDELASTAATCVRKCCPPSLAAAIPTAPTLASFLLSTAICSGLPVLLPHGHPAAMGTKSRETMLFYAIRDGVLALLAAPERKTLE